MAFFEWDNVLDIGVKAMDQQHQLLVKMMDKLYTQNHTQVSKLQLIESVNELFRFVVKHFREEERFMKSINFPNLEAHKKIHQNLLRELEELSKDFKESYEEKLSSEFVIFLKFWLSTHIMGIDNKYGTFAKQMGVV
jgi:hemerythrin